MRWTASTSDIRVGDLTVAVVDWVPFKIEPKINLANLSKVTPRSILE